MVAENPGWGEERIANELKLKFGIMVSPRTVGHCLQDGSPRRHRDSQQRWLTFVVNHAQAVISCDCFVVVTATFRDTVCIRDSGDRLAPRSASQRDRPPNGRSGLCNNSARRGRIPTHIGS